MALHWSKRTHYTVLAKQLGDTSDCDITGVQLLDERSIDPTALQAEKYKFAIGKTLYYSESEEEWFAFYSKTKVRKGFPLDDVKRALNSGDLPVEVGSHKSVLKFLDQKSEGTDDDSYTYGRLKSDLLKDFKELRIFRVGVPDSGAIDIYLVGRTPEGRLVGLKTVSVET